MINSDLLLDIDKHIWPELNSGPPITLETFHPDPAKVRQKVIGTGERIILPKQVQFLMALKKYAAVLFAGAAGPGKIVYRGGEVLTPYGFKKIEDLEVGSLVNNPDGSVAEIVHLHPWTEQQVWRVHFHDGSFTDVAREHLWLAWRTGKGQKRKAKRTFGQSASVVCETERLKEWSDAANKKSKEGGRAYWPCIPICEEQAFTNNSAALRLIDPYLLGSLLGDGHFGDSITLTTADHDHFAKEFSAYKTTRQTKAGNAGNAASSYDFVGPKGAEIRRAIKVLGLHGSRSYNKFIPAAFKHASIDVRYAVVQGLMDTDGTVSAKDGTALYCSCSKQLADDVAFIIRSLGGVVTISKKMMSRKKETYHDAYILYIKHPKTEKLFRLERKKKLVKRQNVSMFRKVVKVEVLDEKRVGRCITVSHPNGLYLTNDFIVTHNSWSLRWALIRILAEWHIPKEFGGLGVSGAQVGLFCNTYRELRDRHVSELKKIDSEIGIYNNDSDEFRLSKKFGGGKILCRNLEDVTKFSSTEFSAIAIDEATLVAETTYDFLLTRLRPNVRGIEHCPVLLASNPGGIGHSWIYRRFVNPDTRDKPYFDEGLKYQNKGNYFIPALPKDNPFLTKQYRATLNNLPEKLRKALNEGDWSVFAGQFFKLDPLIHWIADFDIPSSWNLIRVIDHGGNHPTVCLWMACSPEGVSYVYRELSMMNITASEFKKKVHMMSVDRHGNPEQYRLTIGDPSMKGDGKWVTPEGKTPWTIYNDMMDGIGSFFMTPGNRDRIQGWQALQNALHYEIEGGDIVKVGENGIPIITLTRKPKLYIFRSCIYTWKSFSTVTYDETKNINDVKKTKGTYPPGEGDDEAECARMGYLELQPGSIDRDRTPVRQADRDLFPFPKQSRRLKYPFASF